MVSKIKAGDYAFIWLELPRGTYSVTSRRYRSAMVAITNWYLTARAAQIPCVMIGWLAHLTQHEDVKHIFIQIQDDKQRHQLHWATCYVDLVTLAADLDNLEDFDM